MNVRGFFFSTRKKKINENCLAIGAHVLSSAVLSLICAYLILVLELVNMVATGPKKKDQEINLTSQLAEFSFRSGKP